MSDSRAIRAPHVPSLVPILNPMIRRLLRAGLPFGPNVLLTVRGRSSGTPHTFPVAVLEHDGRRFVQSPFGDVNWVRNLRAAGEAVLSRGDATEEVEAVELPPERAALIFRGALGTAASLTDGRAVRGALFPVSTGCDARGRHRRGAPPPDVRTAAAAGRGRDGCAAGRAGVVATASPRRACAALRAAYPGRDRRDRDACPEAGAVPSAGQSDRRGAARELPAICSTRVPDGRGAQR